MHRATITSPAKCLLSLCARAHGDRLLFPYVQPGESRAPGLLPFPDALPRSRTSPACRKLPLLAPPCSVSHARIPIHRATWPPSHTHTVPTLVPRPSDAALLWGAPCAMQLVPHLESPHSVHEGDLGPSAMEPDRPDTADRGRVLCGT